MCLAKQHEEQNSSANLLGKEILQSLRSILGALLLGWPNKKCHMLFKEDETSS